MTRSAIHLVIALLLLIAVETRGQTPPPPKASTAPLFNGTNLPVPPMQNAPWDAPQSSLPTNYLSAAQVLFVAGLPDPRACEYREIEIGVGSLPVWPPSDRGSSNGVVSTRGWLLPSTNSNRFAICWNGLIYPVLALGKKAELDTDVIGSLTNGNVYWGIIPEEKSVSPLSVSGIQGCLLLRLGKVDFAGRVWRKHFQDTQGWIWVEHRTTNVFGEFKLPQADPYLGWASEWTWVLYERAVFAHMRRDDGLALATLRSLKRIRTAIEAEAERRGFKPPATLSPAGYLTTIPGPHIDFLKPIPDLLADQERRLRKPKRPLVLESGITNYPNQPERIAALIEDLDEDGGSAEGTKALQALIEEGANVVEPLLAFLEKSEKILTRRFTFGVDRGGILNRTRGPHDVHDTTKSILITIMQTGFVGSWATTNELARAGTNQNRIMAAQMRAYWRKFQGVRIEERWYQTLADDIAGQAAWADALLNIVSATPSTNSRPPLRGESLRSKVNPSVTDLVLKRASALDTFAISKWDSQAALPLLRAEMQKHLSLWADAGRFKPWSLEYNGAGGYGCSGAANAIIALTVERAQSGDMEALAQYASWACFLTLPHYQVWKDTRGRRDLCEPMWKFPLESRITNAAHFLFTSTSSPLWQDMSLTNGLRSYALERCGTSLMCFPSFRQNVLHGLRNTSIVGSALLSTNGSLSISTRFGSGGRVIGTNYDTSRVNLGTKESSRLCDYFAKELAVWEEMPKIELYWRQQFRDEALAECIRQVQKRDDDSWYQQKNL